jgi:ABC-type dipeptide/oligopeptide/nickel transport system permease component
MIRFLFRRLLLLVPVLLGMLTVVFILVRVVPGDPVRLMVGFDVDQATVNEMRRQLGLDRPILIQYIDYLSSVVQGDFGRSLRSNRDVSTEVLRHFTNTFKLALLSITLATIIGLTLGVIAAANRGTVLDYATIIVAVLGISAPSYYLGILLILVFAVLLNWLPAGGAGTLRHLILPAVTLAAASTAIVARLTRASLLEVIKKDYVRTASAKGLRRLTVLLRHGLRNALIPIVTALGLEFGFMLGGTVLVEVVFSYPGLGRLLITSIAARDFPMVQGAVIVSALAFVVINLLTDIAYAYLDPKIRY